MLINGITSGQLDARDRGLHYGDGVFTTLRVYEGRPALWERHVARLLDSCSRLGIAPPDEQELLSEAHQVCVGAARGVLKIIITRGVGGRGYAAPRECVPTRIVALYPWPDFPEKNWRKGVAVRVNTMRLAHNPGLAGIKHLNRLEQVLARAEWDDPDIAEGLMLDENNHVIEATAANVFMLRDDTLLTPALHECGVAGVMRALIMELAAMLGQQVRESKVTLNDLHNAEEIFLTNSVIGVWPVRHLQGIDATSNPLHRQQFTQRIAEELARQHPSYV